MLLDFLKMPETRSIDDLDNPSVTELHGEILQKKAFMKQMYVDFYREFRRAVENPSDKTMVEVGSGGGFIKEVIPNVITSDILDVGGVDQVFSATDMPFQDESVDAVFMFNVLHHIAKPEEFFAECSRCLALGGKVVFIEPANTAWARFVYRNFHHEEFDTDGPWGLTREGPLSEGNGAMPWMIFQRDRKKFETLFPDLKITEVRNHTPFRYLLSGGFTLRQLLPGFCYPLAKAFDLVLTPLNNQLGMFMTIILEKQDGTTAG